MHALAYLTFFVISFTFVQILQDPKLICLNTALDIVIDISVYNMLSLNNLLIGKIFLVDNQ